MLLWIETHESDGPKRVESGRIHGKVKVFIFVFSKSHLQMIRISKKTRKFYKMLQKVTCLDDLGQISLLVEYCIFNRFCFFVKKQKSVQSDFALETVLKISEYST